MTAETAPHTLPAELDLRLAEPSFAEEISRNPGCDTIVNCYQCGTCSGTCPVSELDDRFSPAWIIQWVRMGLRRTVLQSPLIWYCLQCHRCSFHCPQGVRFADIDAALRTRAVEEGFITQQQADTIRAMEEQLRQARVRLLNRFFDEGIEPQFSIGSAESDTSAADPGGAGSPPPASPANARENLVPAVGKPSDSQAEPRDTVETETTSRAADGEAGWDQETEDDEPDWTDASDDDSEYETW